MVSRSLPLVLALAVLAAGCPKPLTPDQRLNKAAPASTLSLLRAAGDRATVVLLLHPQRWPVAARTLAPFFLVDSAAGTAQKILAAPDLWAVLGRILASDTSGVAWPARLAGWDPTRPIVAALFEPELNDTVRSARVVAPMDLRAEVPPIHHRILIPATDARAMLDCLDGLSGLLNWRALPNTGESAGLKGGRVYRTSSGGVAALVPEGDHLRMEVARGTYDHSRLAERNQRALVEWLARPPVRSAGPVTPALLFAAGRTDLLVAHVRPWAMRDLNSQIGAGSIYAVLGHASAGDRQELMLMGLSEIAGGFLLMTPRGAEFDDWTLSLDLDAGLRMTGVASLTEHGQAAWRAGLASGGPPLAAAKGPALVEMSWSVDTGAMLSAAQVPSGLPVTEQGFEVFDAMARCGFMCHLHFMLRQPLGLLKVLNQHASDELHIHFPRAMAMRLLAIEPGAGPVPVRLAVAASFSAGTDTRWLRKLMAGLGQQAQVDLYTDRLDTADVTRMGIGVDPRQVFELKPAGQAVGQVGRFSVGTDALANTLNRFSPDAAAALDKLDDFDGRTWLVDRALVGELNLPLAGAPPRPPLRLPDLAGLKWESPGLLAAKTKGAGCLEEVTRGMIQSGSGVAYASVEERATIMANIVHALQKPLACALAEPDTLAAARRVQLAVALMEAERLERSWKLTEQIQVLDEACKQGHQKACHQADAARAGAKVELAKTAGGCLGPWNEDESILRVGVDQPEVARLAAQSKGDRVQPWPLFALDQGVRGERLLGLARALRAVEIFRMDLLVQTPDRGLARFPIELGLDCGPKGKPGPGPFDLALLVSPGEVTLRGPGGELPVAKDDLATAITETLDELQKHFSSVRINVLPTRDITWKDLAPVLAAATCGRDDPKAGIPRRPLRLALDSQALDALLKPKRTAAQAKAAALERAAALLADPPPGMKVTSGEIRMGPTLSVQEIKKVIDRHKAGVRQCYERALLKNPALEGKVTVKFTVGPKGTVTKVGVEPGGLEHSALTSCMLERVRAWVFPAPLGGGIVEIVYPFVFKAVE